MRTALVAGSSGLTGKQCLYRLLEEKEYSRVTALVRKPLAIKHAKLEQVVADFDNLHLVAEKISADDVFCCLGTTIRKAGTQERFRKVDLEYPLQVARMALQNGARQFLLVSALGADKNSRFFYNRVKGEVEELITGLGYSATHIFRPSLLLGPRSDRRVLEYIAQILLRPINLVLVGPLKKYRAIEGATVGKAMVKAALAGKTGANIYEVPAIMHLAHP